MTGPLQKVAYRLIQNSTNILGRSYNWRLETRQHQVSTEGAQYQGPRNHLRDTGGTKYLLLWDHIECFITIRLLQDTWNFDIMATLIFVFLILVWFWPVGKKRNNLGNLRTWNDNPDLKPTILIPYTGARHWAQRYAGSVSWIWCFHWTFLSGFPRFCLIAASNSELPLAICEFFKFRIWHQIEQTGKLTKVSNLGHWIWVFACFLVY